MKVRPDPDSIPPQGGVGGGAPRPRKERLDSARMTVPTRVVSRTMIGGMMFGRMCRHRMRFVEAPIDCAACTHIFSRTDTTAERMMREPAMPHRKPSVKIICGKPGPRTGTTDSTMMRAGDVIH